MPNHTFYAPTAAMLNEHANGLVQATRSASKAARPYEEQLYAAAITFYRWFYETGHDDDELREYKRIFIKNNPRQLTMECQGRLLEARFVLWFVEYGHEDHFLTSPFDPVAFPWPIHYERKERSFMESLMLGYLEQSEKERLDRYGDDPSKFLTSRMKMFIARLPDPCMFDDKRLMSAGITFFEWCQMNLYTEDDAETFAGYQYKFANLFPMYVTRDFDRDVRDAQFLFWFIARGLDRKPILGYF